MTAKKKNKADTTTVSTRFDDNQKELLEKAAEAADCTVAKFVRDAALQKAVEFEANAAKFYADLAAACTNPQEEKFFRMLSGIEREHMLSIKDSLFYLEDPEGWFEEQERQNLEG